MGQAARWTDLGRLMSKPEKRWPMWKLAATAIGFGAGAAAMFVLAVVVKEPELAGEEVGTTPFLTLATFFIMIGVALAMLALLLLGLLSYRIRESRIPVWERKKPRRRRKRR
jgi:hypothetical protein